MESVMPCFIPAASAPSPLYDTYAARWHFGPTTVTVIFAVYAIALLAVLLTAGTLSDSIGRRHPAFLRHRLSGNDVCEAEAPEQLTQVDTG